MASTAKCPMTGSRPRVSLFGLPVLAWCLRVLVLAGLACILPAAGAPPLVLDEEEQAWVAAHPVLRLGVAMEFPPYYFNPSPPLRPHGFLIEMIDLWAERLGLRVEIKRYASAERAAAALLSKEVDLLPFALPSDAGPASSVFTLPALASDLVLVVRRDMPDVSAANDFGHYRLSAVEGTAASMVLRQRFPRAKLRLFSTPENALLALASGATDLFVGYQQVVVYHIEKLLLANLVMRRNLGPGPVTVGPAVRADAVELRGLLGRARASVTAADHSALASRWLPASMQARLDERPAQLSAAERAWVEANGRIRIGYDRALSPITRQGDLGEPEGLGIDFLHLAVRKTGLSVVCEIGGSSADVYARGAAGDIDVIVAITRAPQRRGDYDFVGPFARMPTAIIMRVNDPSMLSATEEFGTRRVALLKQDFLIPELKARHPGIRLLEFESQEQALEAVADGRADVALGNVKVINELIERRFAGGLRITGTVSGGDSELYFGVRRGLPELTQVLRKGLDAVSDAERSAITQRWLVTTVQPGVNWRRLLTWGVPLVLALVAGLGLLWRSNRRLAAARLTETRARGLAEASTASRGRFLAYLSHELRGTLGAVASGADMLKATPDPVFQQHLLSSIAESARGLGQVLDATLSFEQTLLKPVELRSQTIGLQALWAQLVAGGRLVAVQKGLAFHAICNETDLVVQVDVARLQQVVGNLLQNAMKFTAEGAVTVEGRWLSAGAGLSGSPVFEIRVSDSGPGLSEADLSRIFEPYAQGEQGERQRHGAGLGLAISRQIVAAMHGSLEAQSRPGEGATFVLRLPLQPLAAMPSAKQFVDQFVGGGG